MRARGPRGRERGGCPRSQHGAVAVEFALVLPLLVMLMFGIFTSGMTFSDHLSVTNSVREAARLGAAVDYSTGPTAWADAVQERVRQVYFNAGGTLSSNQVCVRLEDSLGTSPPLASPTSQGSTCSSDVPTSPTGMAGGSCVVKVWVTKPAEISLMVFPAMKFNIGAKSVSYYGRTAGVCKAS